MEQQIQDLIASIRKDGIESAKAESERMIAEARKEAESIVAQAKAESSRILSEAAEGAKLEKTSAEASVRQAARDAALSVKRSIEEKYTSILRDAASEAMKGDALASMIAAVIEGDISSKAVEASPSDAEALRKTLSGSFADTVRKGLEVRPSAAISAGFRVVEKDGSGYVDYSADECAKLLMPYLSDSLREILA